MVTAMTAGHVISTEKISAGEGVLQFLSDTFKLPVDQFPLKNPSALKIHLASTEGGRIPVISTGCHDDFCYMEALDIVEAKVAELCQEKASDFII